MIPNVRIHGKKRTLLYVLLLAALFITYVVLLTQYGPERIVETLGVRNGYLTLFFAALIGGATSFTAGSYYALVATLSAGGLNPYLLALVAGIGATFGDTFLLYMGRQGSRTLEEGRVSRMVERLTIWLDARPRWVTPVVAYLYAGFTPFPNDVLAIALGLTNRPYVSTVAGLVLGNMTSTLLVALFGQSVMSFS